MDGSWVLIGEIEMSQKFAQVDKNNVVIAFYADDIHTPEQIPTGCIEITDEEWQMLLNGQSAGKVMKVDSQNNPILADRPPPTKEQLSQALIAQRDEALSKTDWLMQRHSDEVLFGEPTTLTKEQATELNQYRKALRNITVAPGFPNIKLPAPPSFVKG